MSGVSSDVRYRRRSDADELRHRSQRSSNKNYVRFDDADDTLRWTAEEKVRRSVLPTLKLGNYDGTTCL